MVVPVEIAVGRRRSQIMKNAALSNHPLFSSLPQAFLEKFSRSERLSSKLYKISLEEFGPYPPANRLVDAFLTAPVEDLKRYSKILGLSFSLPTFGSVLSRTDMNAIKHYVGDYGVKKVLDYATVNSEVPIRNYESLSACLPHMEADGWVMIEFWARHNNVNPRWRIKRSMTADSGITTLSGGLAIDLVNRAMADLANEGNSV